jgi:hypothetical protein
MDDIIVEIPGVGEVAFPSTMSRDEINAAAQKLYQESQQQAAPAPSMQDQIGRQLGLTGRAAISGIAALPNIIADPFARLAGMTPPSEALQRTLTQAGLPEPQSTLERYVQAGTEALTGAGGQISLARRAAEGLASPVSRAVSGQLAQAPATQLAAAPAATSAAMKTFEETGSPLAATAAGVVAGGATGLRPRKIEPIPTTEELGEQATRAYQRASDAGVIVKPEAVQEFSKRITKKIAQEGYRPRMQPKIAIALDEIDMEGATPSTLDQLDSLRQVVKDPAGDFSNKKQQRLANMIIRDLDNFIENLQGKDLLAGDADRAVSALKEARQVYARNRKADFLEEVVNKADLSSTQYSQSGMENALRVQFRALAKNKTKMAQFSKEEQDQIRKIVKGDTLQNTLRFIGKFAPTGVVSAIPTAGAAFASPYLAAAVPAVTYPARQAAESMSMANIDALMNMVRMGRTPEVTQTRTGLVPTTALRGLLSSQQGME